jgi:hypothetical protein
VNILMAACTQSDEVLCRIVSELAAEIQMMYLKISPIPAFLASPAIALQHSRA